MGIFAMNKKQLLLRITENVYLIVSRQQIPGQALGLTHLSHMEATPLLLIPEETMVEKYNCTTLKKNMDY